MGKFRFLEWEVYKDAKKLMNLVLGIVKAPPKEYRFDMGSQLVRSALSVVLNIAEGSGKKSDKELNRYFEVALGSLYETLAASDVLYDNKLITKKAFEELFKMVESISNQLGGFKKKLNGS